MVRLLVDDNAFPRRIPQVSTWGTPTLWGARLRICDQSCRDLPDFVTKFRRLADREIAVEIREQAGDPPEILDRTTEDNAIWPRIKRRH
jgi:hypothetical protein